MQGKRRARISDESDATVPDTHEESARKRWRDENQWKESYADRFRINFNALPFKRLQQSSTPRSAGLRNKENEQESAFNFEGLIDEPMDLERVRPDAIMTNRDSLDVTDKLVSDLELTDPSNMAAEYIPRPMSYGEWSYKNHPTEKQLAYQKYLEATKDLVEKRRMASGYKHFKRRTYRKRSYRSYGGGRYNSYKRRRYGGRYRRGYGSYWDPDTKAWKSGFAPDYGSRLGSTVGEGVQSFAQVAGLGEYTVKKNSLMGCINTMTDPPVVKNTSKGEATVINHREYLGELMTGAGAVSAFDLQSYSINPGNSKLFPWLATMAQNFQEWEPRGIIVELKTESSDYAASLSLGSMFMGVNYNSLDDDPTTKIELEQLEYAVSSKPSKSCIMPIECALVNDVITHLYIAIDDNYKGGDPRFYDLGNLYIGSYGVPNTGGISTPIAEVWISYEMAFYKPRLYNDLNIGQQVMFVLDAIAPNAPFGSVKTPLRSEDQVVSTVTGITLTDGDTITWTKAYSQDTYWYINYYAWGNPTFSFTSTPATTGTVTLINGFVSRAGALVPGYQSASAEVNQDYYARGWVVKVAANSVNEDFIWIGWGGSTGTTSAHGGLNIFELDPKIIQFDGHND